MPEIYMIQIANTPPMVNPKSYDSKRIVSRHSCLSVMKLNLCPIIQ